MMVSIVHCLRKFLLPREQKPCPEMRIVAPTIARSRKKERGAAIFFRLFSFKESETKRHGGRQTVG
jgi:hypothetical protein